MKKIILVDDHQLFREGLKVLLETVPGFKVVAEFGEVSGLYDALVEHQPDLVVLDYNIPGGGSLAALEYIKKRFPEIKLIALTGVHSSMLFQQLEKSKADGIFLKEMSASEMIEAIKNIFIGKKVFSGAVKECLTDSTKKLTGREFQIMDLIVTGLSNAEISEKLNLSAKTVENHRYNLMQKLELKNSVELVKYAHQHGLFLDNVSE